MAHASTSPRQALPAPRGALSRWVLRTLAGGPRTPVPAVASGDPLGDEDLQLALYCCYETMYRGFDGTAEDLEWDPDLLAVRARMEAVFEAELRARVEVFTGGPGEVVPELWAMTTSDGPSMSAWLLEHGSRDQALELAIHRSPYQLKEADPHTWAIPRLTGEAKAAMVTIQFDEYGEGQAAAMHASLFADTMRALGLDATYGAYLDRVPAVTLATVNLISLLGLHRRLRGALVGHLAGFEMNSVGPMGRYSAWMERLGMGTDGRAFYDVHVVADEVHQHVAADRLVGGLLADEPNLAAEVVFGARALSLVEGRFASHVLTAWGRGQSSLRPDDRRLAAAA